MSEPREPVVQPDADVESVARTIVLDRLAERARSRAELAETLAKKHVPDEVAQSILDRCEAAGLVNDQEFARSWVESRQRSKGLAGRVLSMELKRKGISDDIAQEVLAEVDPDSERAAAHHLVQRKLRSMSRLDSTTKIRRLTAMLARKGYAPQVAFDVVRAELEGAELERAESGDQGLVDELPDWDVSSFQES